VILKSVSPPSMREFDSVIAKTRKQARLAGLKKSDLNRVLAKVRSRR